MPLKLPHRLADRYELISQIGEGGFAHVYRATDTHLDRLVAVKILKEEHALNSGFVSRFQREARAAARVHHPNVVQVFDSGQDNGTLFIIMELIEGRDLKAVIHERAPEPFM